MHCAILARCQPAVKKAYEKLQFALSLSHTKEELEKMADDKAYHLRLSAPSDGTYDNLVLRWCGEDIEVYCPANSQAYAGTGNLMSDPRPAIMYIKTRS